MGTPDVAAMFVRAASMMAISQPTRVARLGAYAGDTASAQSETWWRGREASLRVADDQRWRVEMIGTRTATLRLRGSGDHLRLRVALAPDPLANVRECCRASVAVEKAPGEVIRDALAAGHSWAEVAQALGVAAETSVGVREQYDASRSWMRTRFWSTAGKETA